MLTKLLEYNSFESDRLEKGMINSSQLRLPIRTIGGLLNSYYYQGTTPRDSNLIGLGWNLEINTFLKSFLQLGWESLG